MEVSVCAGMVTGRCSWYLGQCSKARRYRQGAPGSPVTKWVAPAGCDLEARNSSRIMVAPGRCDPPSARNVPAFSGDLARWKPAPRVLHRADSPLEKSWGTTLTGAGRRLSCDRRLIEHVESDERTIRGIRGT